MKKMKKQDLDIGLGYIPSKQPSDISLFTRCVVVITFFILIMTAL